MQKKVMQILEIERKKERKAGESGRKYSPIMFRKLPPSPRTDVSSLSTVYAMAVPYRRLDALAVRFTEQ